MGPGDRGAQGARSGSDRGGGPQGSAGQRGRPGARQRALEHLALHSEGGAASVRGGAPDAGGEGFDMSAPLTPSEKRTITRRANKAKREAIAAAILAE
jgi:hypothetical protein